MFVMFVAGCVVTCPSTTMICSSVVKVVFTHSETWSSHIALTSTV